MTDLKIQHQKIYVLIQKKNQILFVQGMQNTSNIREKNMNEKGDKKNMKKFCKQFTCFKINNKTGAFSNNKNYIIYIFLFSHTKFSVM